MRANTWIQRICLAALLYIAGYFVLLKPQLHEIKAVRAEIRFSEATGRRAYRWDEHSDRDPHWVTSLYTPLIELDAAMRPDYWTKSKGEESVPEWW